MPKTFKDLSESQYDRLMQLYEVADGVAGEGAWRGGIAVEKIREMGFDYPATKEQMALS